MILTRTQFSWLNSLVQYRHWSIYRYHKVYCIPITIILYYHPFRLGTAGRAVHTACRYVPQLSAWQHGPFGVQLRDDCQTIAEFLAYILLPSRLSAKDDSSFHHVYIRRECSCFRIFDDNSTVRQKVRRRNRWQYLWHYRKYAPS